MDSLQVILPAMFILLVIGASVVQLKDRLNRKSMCIVLTAIISAEIFANTFTQLLRQDQDIVYSTRPSYVDVIVPTREVVDEIKAEDEGFYRIEKTYHRTVNDPMAAGMYGLSHSSSTLNAKPIELLSRLGFSARSHYTRSSGGTEITNSLLGVKYILSCEDNSTANIKSKEDITVTENKFAMPMAYLVDNDIEDLELSATEPLANQNELLMTMLNGTQVITDETQKQEYFSRIIDDVDLELTNVTQGKTTDGHHSFKQKKEGLNTEIVYTFEMPVTSALYMYLPSKYERTVNVWLNRETFLGTYFEGDNNSIMKIGDFEAGESVTIGLTLTRSDLYFREAQFLYCDAEAISADLGALQARNSETVVERTAPTKLKITVNAGSEDMLFTTVPVEKGWTVKVDGVETEYVELLDALIGVPLNEGQHVIEMSFTTAGYPMAIIITAAGTVIFIAMIILSKVILSKKKENAEEEADFEETEE